MKLKNILRIAAITIALLLVPLVLTLLGSGADGDGFHWTLSDFVIMGGLIFFTGLALDTVIRRTHGNRRFIIGGAVVAAFFYIWAELAVGVFTNWGS